MKYRCVKTVEAEPQKLTEEMAKRFEGTSKVGDDGYKVIYSDGFESWSPKEVFEKGYIPEPKDFKERLIEELKELFKKECKLDDFLESEDSLKKVSTKQANLMQLQLEAMNMYDHILALRLVDMGIDMTKEFGAIVKGVKSEK